MPQINADIPECFDFLFSPARYKVAFGGRGSGKSHSFARALIIRSIQRKTRVLCAREVQKSIRESVHKLLCDVIDTLGVTKLFTVTETSILCRNGSEFIFEGLFRNVNRIKSLEGVDICWLEEAESISEESYTLLLPTIRKESSEIWVSFNTGYESDPTYQRWVVSPPEGAVVRLINYDLNPYFPDTLKREMEADRVRLDRSTWENIWLGKPRRSGGRVWVPFDPDIHVARSKLVPLSLIAAKGNAFASIDPHSAYYPAIIFGAIVPRNDRGRWPEDYYKVIYDEWPNRQVMGGDYADLRHKAYFTGSLADIARVLVSKEVQRGADGKDYHIPHHQRYIDTRYAKGAGGGSWSTSTSGIVQEFARPDNGGIILTLPPERMIDAQRAVLIDEMRYNTVADLNTYNEPTVLIYPNCVNLIRSLKNHRYEEDSEREADTGEKDFSDAFRIWRAGVSEWRYKPPTDPEIEREQKIYERKSYGGGAPTGWMGA
jgi:DNA polymerase III delta prime subunit